MPITGQVATRSSEQLMIIWRLLGSTDVLEQLTELSEFPYWTVYSPDHWFIIKGHINTTARWKRCTGQGMWEGAWRIQLVSECATLPNLHVVTNWGALQTLSFCIFYRRFITWACLVKWWLNSNCSSSPAQQVGLNYNPLIKVGSPGNNHPTNFFQKLCH